MKNISIVKQLQSLIHPHEKKSRSPAWFRTRPAHCAVLFEQVYLAMKELEERGTPLSEVRAEQPEVDPLLTLTKPKKADRKNQSSFHQPGKLLQACRLCSQD